MASVFLLAELTGRQHSAITALVLAAAVMVAFEPYILWSVSLQNTTVSSQVDFGIGE